MSQIKYHVTHDYRKHGILVDRQPSRKAKTDLAVHWGQPSHDIQVQKTILRFSGNQQHTCVLKQGNPWQSWDFSLMCLCCAKFLFLFWFWFFEGRDLHGKFWWEQNFLQTNRTFISFTLENSLAVLKSPKWNGYKLAFQSWLSSLQQCFSNCRTCLAHEQWGGINLFSSTIMFLWMEMG